MSTEAGILDSMIEGTHTFNLICEILNSNFQIEEDSVIGIYEYGSSVYGTRTTKSDRDYVVVVKSANEKYFQYESIDIDLHIMTLEEYRKSLDAHNIMALETYFNPNSLLPITMDFELDLVKLRHKFSSTISNSWVKAKKKVTLENEDDWIGYKSLFHSMRILDFGIQIAEYGRINNFQSVTPVWLEIVEKVNGGIDIKDLMAYYKPTQNKNMTKFRLLAPKE